MSSQAHSPQRHRSRGRIAIGAAMAGVLAATAGCGVAASNLVLDARPAAAHEAIQPAAGEGSLGPLAPGNHSPRRPGAGGSGSMLSFGNALFGGNDGLANQEGALHRKLAIVRVYYHIGEPFPMYIDQRHMAEGSTLLVSLDSQGASYASIAGGATDASIRGFLRAVNRAAFQYHLKAIYISFEHEPDGPQHAGLGSPAEFTRAWNHVHRIAASAHLNWNDGGRLHWVLILIHNTYANGAAAPYWPGAGSVDIVAADGYNSYRCGHDWQQRIPTPAELFNPLLGFASAHGLPAFISEWGSDSATPTAQPQFIGQMRTYVTGNRAITAAMYWDDGGGSCNYRVDGHPTSLAALATMGYSPGLQASAVLH